MGNHPHHRCVRSSCSYSIDHICESNEGTKNSKEEKTFQEKYQLHRS